MSESDSGEESNSFEEDGFESDAEHDKEEDVYADDEEDQDGMEEAPEGHREEFEQVRFHSNEFNPVTQTSYRD